VLIIALDWLNIIIISVRKMVNLLFLLLISFNNAFSHSNRKNILDIKQYLDYNYLNKQITIKELLK